MKTVLVLSFLSIVATSLLGQHTCYCDTVQARNAILASDFNSIPEYDTIPAHGLYELSGAENRRLWYRDVENPDTTKFTRYWNDYVDNNYRADNNDFIHYYENSFDVEIAFQFGPNMDLWAYHIFVIRKIGCCYLATRSYFRHARFTYKAYAIVSQNEVDGLYHMLDPLNKVPIDTTNSRTYGGYFVDNRSESQYYVNFTEGVTRNNREPKKEILDLHDFLNNRIDWVTTYKL